MMWVYIIIAVVVVVGVIWWAMSKKKDGQEQVGGPQMPMEEKPAESKDEEPM